MDTFFALKIVGDDGYLGHFDDDGKPIPVLIQHALLYKNAASFESLEVVGTVVKVTLTVSDEF